MNNVWTKEKVLEKIQEFHQKLGRRPSKYEVGSLYMAARKVFGTWANALRCAGYDVKPMQKVRLPEALTRELSYFVGLVLTDGHIVHKHTLDRQNKMKGDFAVKLYTSYEDEKKIIIRLIKELFGYTPLIRPRKYGFNKPTNYEIIVSSKILTEFLMNEFQMPAGKKSSKIRVPKIFWGHKFFPDLLRGIIDGDGGAGTEGVGIYSSSKEFLTDIISILAKMKIKTHNPSKSKSNVWRTTIPIVASMRLYGKLYKGSRYFYPKLKDAWEKNILMYDRQTITRQPPVA